MLQLMRWGWLRLELDLLSLSTCTAMSVNVLFSSLIKSRTIHTLEKFWNLLCHVVQEFYAFTHRINMVVTQKVLSNYSSDSLFLQGFQGKPAWFTQSSWDLKLELWASLSRSAYHNVTRDEQSRMIFGKGTAIHWLSINEHLSLMATAILCHWSCGHKISENLWDICQLFDQVSEWSECIFDAL